MTAWGRTRSVRLYSLLPTLLIAVLVVASHARNIVWVTDIILWEDTVSKSPSRTRSVGKLGEAYHDAQEYDKALQIYQRSIQLDPTSTHIVYNNMGAVYFEMKHYDKAIHYFTLLLSFEADKPKTYLNRGNAYFRNGSYAQAIRDFDAAIVLDRENVDILVNRGAAYYNLGRTKLAHADYQKACFMGAEAGCARLKEMSNADK